MKSVENEKKKNWQRKKGDKVVENKMWKREREREQEKGGKREK